MDIYSIKMRASQRVNGITKHISGAERILPQNVLAECAGNLIERAINHSKGHADFVNLKIEEISKGELEYIDALPVSTIEASSPKEGREELFRLLAGAGISNPDVVLEKISETYPMRGAMLLDADTYERLEPDLLRGIRATYMDGEPERLISMGCGKNHFQEAIILASKVANAPHIVAEICISDDPMYATGYFASKEAGYVRITNIKEKNSPNGGRIFLYRGPRECVVDTISYLEKRKIIVKNAPLTPTSLQIPDPLKRMGDILQRRKDEGLYRSITTLDSKQNAHVEGNGYPLLMLASNSYLGLIGDPRIENAAVEAVWKYGTGTGGSRLTTGTLPLHSELEDSISKFYGTESALLFGTGYMANVGILSALGMKDAVIFSDELNHASIIDGCRLSHVKIVVYRHLDMNDLEAKIKIVRPTFGIIASDGVFSMDGDLAPLPDILGIAKKYGLLTMVDEAHAIGVVGKRGRGLAEYYSLHTQPDILMGTLSKSLASEGGFATGREIVIDYLRNMARSFIFSTSQTPANLATAIKALEILQEEPERVEKLRRNTEFFTCALRKFGIDVHTNFAIVPIIVGDEGKATAYSDELRRRGILIPAIRHPAVLKGTARLRATLMATHDGDELKNAAKEISEVVK